MVWDSFFLTHLAVCCRVSLGEWAGWEAVSIAGLCEAGCRNAGCVIAASMSTPGLSLCLPLSAAGPTLTVQGQLHTQAPARQAVRASCAPHAVLCREGGRACVLEPPVGTAPTLPTLRPHSVQHSAILGGHAPAGPHPEGWQCKRAAQEAPSQSEGPAGGNPGSSPSTTLLHGPQPQFPRLCHGLGSL